MLDPKVIGGPLVDGTSRPRTVGDVAIENDRLVRVDRRAIPAGDPFGTR